MAYSQIEQGYLNLLADSMLPPPEPAAEPSLDGMQLAAGPTQTRTDAPQGYGSIRAIEPTTFEKALQSAGIGLEQAGRFLDGLGQVDVPGLGSISLADIVPFVGSAKPGTRSVMGEPDWQGTPKVLQAPAAGQPIVTGKGQTMQLSEDAKLAAMDAAFNAKPVATGIKKAGQALAPTAVNMMEQYLTKTGAILKMAPDSPSIEVPSAPKLNTPAFKKWFGESKVVDDKGQPMVMYHGTPANIEQFIPQDPTGRSKAIFVSPDPKFAEGFAGGEFTIAEGGSPNVIPLYVRAQNPFDFDNPKHRSMVIDLVMEHEPLYITAPDKEGMRRVLENALTDKNANWSTLEQSEFQKAIKELGFDSFYVKEEGIKNLAVYDAKQIKSVFNKGTFDPKDPRILYGSGTTGVAAQDEEKK